MFLLGCKKRWLFDKGARKKEKEVELKQANSERELKKRRIMKDKLHAFKMLHRGRFSSISMPLHKL